MDPLADSLALTAARLRALTDARLRALTDARLRALTAARSLAPISVLHFRASVDSSFTLGRATN